MFSDALLDHFRDPRNVGELPPPALTIEVSNPACGDILKLSVLFDGDRIAEARYRVRGCTASIAAGSVLTEMIVGTKRAALGSISAADLEDRLGGLPAESRHAAVLCIDGLKAMRSRISATSTFGLSS
jgi:nitrogen fixation NifU-like protein